MPTNTTSPGTDKSKQKRKFEGIFRSGRIKGMKAGDQMVRDFFIDKAMQTKLTRSPAKIMESPSAVAHSVSRPTPGKMIMYQYDAKHKDTLPYWDKFPVVLPLNLYNDSFLGLNLHYLPPVHRIRLLDVLYETVNNDKFDATTKMQVSYQILNQAAKFRYFKPCVKKYLYSHVKSNIIEIPVPEWDYTVFLPLARFQKATERKVWDDSIHKIMRS